MVITRAGVYRAAAKAVSTSREKEKGVSQQQEDVNGVNANQRSDEVKYGSQT
jgi:hypothetical protein